MVVNSQYGRSRTSAREAVGRLILKTWEMCSKCALTWKVWRKASGSSWCRLDHLASWMDWRLFDEASKLWRMVSLHGCEDLRSTHAYCVWATEQCDECQQTWRWYLVAPAAVSLAAMSPCWSLEQMQVCRKSTREGVPLQKRGAQSEKRWYVECWVCGHGLNLQTYYSYP